MHKSLADFPINLHTFQLPLNSDCDQIYPSAGPLFSLFNCVICNCIIPVAVIMYLTIQIIVQNVISCILVYLYGLTHIFLSHLLHIGVSEIDIIGVEESSCFYSCIVQQKYSQDCTLCLVNSVGTCFHHTDINLSAIQAPPVTVFSSACAGLAGQFLNVLFCLAYIQFVRSFCFQFKVEPCLTL